jgi:hypothetical protein
VRASRERLLHAMAAAPPQVADSRYFDFNPPEIIEIRRMPSPIPMKTIMEGVGGVRRDLPWSTNVATSCTTEKSATRRPCAASRTAHRGAGAPYGPGHHVPVRMPTVGTMHRDPSIRVFERMGGKAWTSMLRVGCPTIAVPLFVWLGRWGGPAPSLPRAPVPPQVADSLTR